MLHEKHLLLLELLEPISQEHYGFDLADRSNGKIGRGSVHVYLSRLQDEGLVESRKEEPSKSKYVRSLYRLTQKGRRVRESSQVPSTPKGRWILTTD